MLSQVAAALAADAATVALDLRGHGGSPDGAQDAHSLARDVATVLRVLVGERDVVLMGHSLGAVVAARAALGPGDASDETWEAVPNVRGVVRPAARNPVQRSAMEGGGNVCAEDVSE